jgi:hypothetical protein
MRRALRAIAMMMVGLPVAAMAANGFELDPAAQQRLGVTTVAAAGLHYVAEAEGSGSAVDLAPLLTLDADLSAAEAALSASSANYRRTQTLHADRDNASTQALEAARAQFVADQARRDALRRQLRSSGGVPLAALGPSERMRLFERLSRGDAVLLRADFSPGTRLATTSRVRVAAADAAEPPLSARVLGRTANANPQRPGPGLLLLVDAPDWLQPGRNVRVLAPSSGAAQDGVRLPLSAVLHREGALWAYVKIAANRFERRRLAGVVSLPDAVFATTGVRVGEAVVTRGAASLLAAELAPPPGAAAEED